MKRRAVFGRPSSIRARLGIALGAVAVCSVAASALIAFGLVRNQAERAAHADLERMARAVAVDLAGTSADEPVLRVPRRVLRVSGAHLAVVLADGSLRGEDASFARGIDVAPLLDGREIRGVVDTASGDFAYVGLPGRIGRAAAGSFARPRERVAGAPARGVVLGRPVSFAADVWRPIVARLALAAAAAVAVAAGISALVARRVTRPLRQVADATRRVAAGDLSQRVEVTSTDELGELAVSFNAMASALAEAQRREREFLGAVSHELRTPLTAVRGYVEALQEGAVRDAAGRREALEVIRTETARLERLVQDVMDLARLGAKEFRLEPREADLADTVREAGAAHAAQASAAGLRLEVDAPDGLTARTDPDRVRQVVSNLVENALRVTPAGGTIRVAALADGDRVRIAVEDSGPGIAPEHVPHVFERSYLWKAVRGEREVGTGLGLMIVRELVAALGGGIEVASEPGRGTSFRLWLPREAPR